MAWLRLPKEAPAKPIAPGIRWQKIDYDDKNSLVETLRGTHTLLSFVQILSDPDQKSQKNLIDAAIAAGVKRFAPSDYGRREWLLPIMHPNWPDQSKDIVDMPWWCGKELIREYLRKVNEKENVNISLDRFDV